MWCDMVLAGSMNAIVLWESSTFLKTKLFIALQYNQNSCSKYRFGSQQLITSTKHPTFF